MKILLFGKHGQLGWELNRTLQPLGEVEAYDYPEVDFSEPSSLEPLVRMIKPRIVINAIAYTDVDRAESEVDKARLINAEAPAVLAAACRDLGISFLHYSTDFVFDGRKETPYMEDDRPSPLNTYGQTKLEGERAVLGAGGANLVFRTAWVYSLRGNNFVTKVLRWARTQPELRVVNDQVGNPTWARALAEVSAQLVAKAGLAPLPWLSERSGLYHLAGRGIASRYEMAQVILQVAQAASPLAATKILPARTDDFPSNAVRPKYSALECSRFERVFSLRLPDWKVALRLALEE
jgi:dTDP-4-dehydrorhamnose reductase